MVSFSVPPTDDRAGPSEASGLINTSTKAFSEVKIILSCQSLTQTPPHSLRPGSEQI